MEGGEQSISGHSGSSSENLPVWLQKQQRFRNETQVAQSLNKESLQDVAEKEIYSLSIIQQR